MSSVTASSGLFHDLFAPLPHTPATRDKDYVDHVAEYADSAAGTWDVFRVIDLTLSYVKMLPSLSPSWLEMLGKVKDVANMAGIGLSIPKMIADCNTFRRSLSNLLAVHDLPYSDPLRTRKIAQAFKKSFVDSFDLTWTCTQAALFLNNAKIFMIEATQLRMLDGLNNIASVVSDSAELITECFKLKHFHSPEAQPRNPAESTKLEERKCLSWMTVVKDVTSIGTAAIALVGIIFGVATQSIAAIGIAVLVLSTVWLTMKLSTYFYNKIVVEAPISMLNQSIAL
jgi:hypothetical protein